MSGAPKVYLDALVALRQEPTSAIVSDAIMSLVRGLPEPDRSAIDTVVSRALWGGATRPRPEPKAAYKYARLCFKRKVIDRLKVDEEFRIETPVGTFQMSRAEFDVDFGKISKTMSWKNLGFYSYPVVPSKAEKYRIAANSGLATPGTPTKSNAGDKEHIA